MAGVELRTVDLDGVGLSIAEAGAGQHPILILHGFTGAKEDFTEWLDPLAEAGWHAVAPDHRGHGSSAKPGSEDAYSFEILADDAVRLADVLGWPSASRCSATRWAGWWLSTSPAGLPSGSRRWS